MATMPEKKEYNFEENVMSSHIFFLLYKMDT